MGIWKLNHEIRDCTLPASHKAVMWVLESYICEPTQAAFPSLDTLARQSGLSRSSVKRTLKELAEHKIVKWKQHPIGDQMVNHYYFNRRLISLGGRFTVDLLWVQGEPGVGSNEGEGRSTVNPNSIKIES